MNRRHFLYLLATLPAAPLAAADPPKRPEPVAYNPKMMDREFRSNPVAAAADWEGKWLRITDRVDRIHSPIRGFCLVETPYTRLYVSTADVKKLTLKGNFTFVGKFSEYEPGLYVTLDPAELER
jgi:hypothetical protein